MKKLSVLFVLAASSALAQQPHAGYEYRAPAEPSLLAPPAPAQPLYHPAYHNYAHLAQNRFLPSTNYPYVDDYHRNQYRQPQQDYQYSPNYHAQYNSAQSNYQNLNYDSYNQNFGNINSLGIQSGQQTVQTNSGQSNEQAGGPVITKHIYFHLPPPDDAGAAAPAPPAPPKKTYNIIFIKLPSQKSASAARLQQILNQQAIENKTLIYVLVKKPETQPVQPITSKPEVFFVKYKDPRSVPQPVNTGSVQVPILQNSAPELLPGLVNGHRN